MASPVYPKPVSATPPTYHHALSSVCTDRYTVAIQYTRVRSVTVTTWMYSTAPRYAAHAICCLDLLHLLNALQPFRFLLLIEHDFSNRTLTTHLIIKKEASEASFALQVVHVQLHIQCRSYPLWQRSVSMSHKPTSLSKYLRKKEIVHACIMRIIHLDHFWIIF